MIKSDFHVHSAYSDGKNTLGEIALEAYRTGMETLGFSDHSPMIIESCWSLKKEKVASYLSDIARLKKQYGGRMKILAGIERDIFSDRDYEECDYVIGSVHHVKKNGVYCSVDNTFEQLCKEVNEYFSGDYLSFAEYYFDEVASLSLTKKPDIIGHFDLLTKFNEIHPTFDTQSERYIKAWKTAADELLKTGALFEINTGAISRGYRTTPYPSKEICEYIGSKGGKFILCSDSHAKETLRYMFDRFDSYAPGILENLPEK